MKLKTVYPLDAQNDTKPAEFAGYPQILRKYLWESPPSLSQFIHFNPIFIF